VGGVLVAIFVWSLLPPPEPLAVLGLARASMVPKLRDALNSFWVWVLAGVGPGPARQMVRKQARGWVRYALHTSRQCHSGARLASVLYVIRVATEAAQAPTTVLPQPSNDPEEGLMYRLVEAALRLDMPRPAASTILGLVMTDAIPEVTPGWQRGTRSEWNKLSPDRMCEVQGAADRLLYFFYRRQHSPSHSGTWQQAGGSGLIVAAAAALHMLWDAATHHALMLPFPHSNFSVRINAAAAALAIVCWQTYADVSDSDRFRLAWTNHWRPLFSEEYAYDMTQMFPLAVVSHLSSAARFQRLTRATDYRGAYAACDFHETAAAYIAMGACTI
jgi:hypothetical protein